MGENQKNTLAFSNKKKQTMTEEQNEPTLLSAKSINEQRISAQESMEMENMMKNDLNMLNIIDQLEETPIANIALYPPGKIFWLSVRDQVKYGGNNTEDSVNHSLDTDKRPMSTPSLYALKNTSFFDKVLISPYIVEDHSIDGIVKHLKCLIDTSKKD